MLLVIFSTAADVLIIHHHKETAMLSRFIMWCPGTAALLTCAICRLPYTGLGLHGPEGRWLRLSYVVPILYALPVYVATWTLLPGSLALSEFERAIAGQYGLEAYPTLGTFGVGVPLLMTVGMLSGLTWALGEELGWRGLLMPRLTQALGFKGACLVSGVVWAVWHYPGLWWADYNAGTDPIWATSCFTISVIGMAFILGWLRLRSASVWPCALLHASHNLFIQGIFDPLTVNAGAAHLITTEFGWGLAVTIGVTAVLLISRERSSGASHLLVKQGLQKPYGGI